MEGDIVKISSIAVETSGVPVYNTDISKKPEFMLDEEYNQEVIGCALEAIKKACETIYPNNSEAQSRLAKMIANKV